MSAHPGFSGQFDLRPAQRAGLIEQGIIAEDFGLPPSVRTSLAGGATPEQVSSLERIQAGFALPLESLPPPLAFGGGAQNLLSPGAQRQLAFITQPSPTLPTQFQPAQAQAQAQAPPISFRSSKRGKDGDTAGQPAGRTTTTRRGSSKRGPGARSSEGESREGPFPRSLTKAERERLGLRTLVERKRQRAGSKGGV